MSAVKNSFEGLDDAVFELSESVHIDMDLARKINEWSKGLVVSSGTDIDVELTIYSKVGNNKIHGKE